MCVPSEVSSVALRMRGNVIEYTTVKGERNTEAEHLLFIIDLVRNVEQCFHMADL